MRVSVSFVFYFVLCDLSLSKQVLKYAIYIKRPASSVDSVVAIPTRTTYIGSARALFSTHSRLSNKTTKIKKKMKLNNFFFPCVSFVIFHLLSVVWSVCECMNLMLLFALWRFSHIDCVHQIVFFAKIERNVDCTKCTTRILIVSRLYFNTLSTIEVKRLAGAFDSCQRSLCHSPWKWHFEYRIHFSLIEC